MPTVVASECFQFSTKPQEGMTGLYYYGYRWLDAGQGRWLSRDPIGEDGGLNLYGFVENNGISWVDLLGWKKVSCAKIAKCIDFGLVYGSPIGATGGFETESTGIFSSRVVYRKLPKEDGYLALPYNVKSKVWFITSRWKNNPDCKECVGLEKGLVVKSFKRVVKFTEDQDEFKWLPINHGDLTKLGAGGTPYDNGYVNTFLDRAVVNLQLPSFGDKEKGLPATDKDAVQVETAWIKYRISIECDGEEIFKRDFYITYPKNKGDELRNRLNPPIWK